MTPGKRTFGKSAKKNANGERPGNTPELVEVVLSPRDRSVCDTVLANWADED